jgi:hypothetical protein
VEGDGGILEAARDAYRRHDWTAARERFTAARAAGDSAAVAAAAGRVRDLQAGRLTAQAWAERASTWTPT